MLLDHGVDVGTLSPISAFLFEQSEIELVPFLCSWELIIAQILIILESQLLFLIRRMMHQKRLIQYLFTLVQEQKFGAGRRDPSSVQLMRRV